MEINVNGQHFQLLPEKALFWKERRMLILGDLHLGKIAHFRKEGIPVPAAASERNFRVLDNLIARFDPLSVFFLGDLFHSSPNREWNEFGIWRLTHSAVEMHVVLGNHDRHLPGFYPPELNLTLHSGEWVSDGIGFAHEPPEKPERFTFCAHIHPVFVLRAHGQRLRLPCLHLKKDVGILPGFGYFTGGFEIAPEQSGDRIFVFTGETVAEIQNLLKA
jgi:DNA ligase-associated metallophosphoesterase